MRTADPLICGKDPGINLTGLFIELFVFCDERDVVEYCGCDISGIVKRWQSLAAKSMSFLNQVDVPVHDDGQLE